MNGKTVKARKNHRCILCEEIIPKDSEYWRERITPWDHPDNECYFTFKAHSKCYSLWILIGDEFDWEYPNDSSYWKELMEDYIDCEIRS